MIIPDNEKFLRIKKVDTDIRIPNGENKFYDYILRNLLDEYYEWKLQQKDKIQPPIS